MTNGNQICPCSIRYQPSKIVSIALVYLVLVFSGLAQATNGVSTNEVSSSAPATNETTAVTEPATNYVAAPLPSSTAPVFLPEPANGGFSSFLRVIGALALVIGLFLGGAWFFRNWQRLNIQRGNRPRLNLIETRSLGGRHAIHVIGYENERFLIASSPSGVNLLSHLPAATAEASIDDATKNPAPPSFAQALTQVLKGK